LEDIYLPFKPKRRTKAMIARENGLQPLHDAILADRSADPAALAAAYVTEAVPDAKAALEGARDILSEGLSESAELLGRLRSHMKQVGRLQAKVVAGKEVEGAKFSDYFAHDEHWTSAPSHRVLAMLRSMAKRCAAKAPPNARRRRILRPPGAGLAMSGCVTQRPGLGGLSLRPR
jgi:uncharacterized protein